MGDFDDFDVTVKNIINDLIDLLGKYQRMKADLMELHNERFRWHTMYENAEKNEKSK